MRGLGPWGREFESRYPDKWRLQVRMSQEYDVAKGSFISCTDGRQNYAKSSNVKSIYSSM